MGNSIDTERSLSLRDRLARIVNSDRGVEVRNLQHKVLFLRLEIETMGKDGCDETVLNRKRKKLEELEEELTRAQRRRRAILDHFPRNTFVNVSDRR